LRTFAHPDHAGEQSAVLGTGVLTLVGRVFGMGAGIACSIGSALAGKIPCGAAGTIFGMGITDSLRSGSDILITAQPKPVMWVDYVTEVSCWGCGRRAVETLWIGVAGEPVLGPFCGDDCLLDAAHMRRNNR